MEFSDNWNSAVEENRNPFVLAYFIDLARSTDDGYSSANPSGMAIWGCYSHLMQVASTDLSLKLQLPESFEPVGAGHNILEDEFVRS